MARWTGHIKATREEKITRRKIYYATHRDAILVERREKKKDPAYRNLLRRQARESQARHPEFAMFNDARKRARRLGVPFDLDKDDIHIPAVCPIDGKPLVSGRGSGFGNGFYRSSMRAPNLDRIKPELGYTRGNVAVISGFWNIRKKDMSASDLRRLANYIDSPPSPSPEHLLSFGG